MGMPAACSAARATKLSGMGHRHVYVSGLLEHQRRQRNLGLGHPDRLHVGEVVIVPEAFGGPGCALCRHARVVRPTVSSNRWIAAVVGQQRPEHGGIGQQEDATRVEKDCVEIRERHLLNITLSRA